jgi:hypothetical protein
MRGEFLRMCRYDEFVPASTNFQVIGLGRAESMRLDGAVQQALAARQGRWRVQFIGGLGEDVWEMRVSGPAVETAEYLDRTLGQHHPQYISELLARIAT